MRSNILSLLDARRLNKVWEELEDSLKTQMPYPESDIQGQQWDPDGPPSHHSDEIVELGSVL